ncbi:MAG TPA: type II secretion system F family protein, partial [Spirochaetota bacterium]|nr:type II secretion system F family protein [Spirochaetota bacterium]
DNSHMKLVLADIRQKLEGGSPLSKAIASHNEVFSEMYSNMIRIGENMGSLDTVLERLADIEEKNANIKNSLKLAFQYPVFMLIFTSCIASFLMIKVVPTISDMFIQLNKELPLPTRIVVGTSSFAAKYWIIILIALVALFILFKKYSKTPEGRNKIDAFMFKIPIFNHFYTKVICLRFCQNLGIMAQNGVDIVKSLEIVKKQIGNTVIEKKIEEASVRIVEGAPISKALITAEFLPKMVTGMISVAEASDTLDSMLIKISDLYQNEIDRSLLSLTKMIEPVLIVVMGGLIGLIVLSIMLPIIDLNLSIQ